MRLHSALAVAALLPVSIAAHADSLTQAFTASGSSSLSSDRSNAVTTSTFAKFDPSLGMLDSFTIAVSGSATNQADFSVDFFGSVTAADHPGISLLDGSGLGVNTFTFSANGTDPITSSDNFFSGTGSEALALEFSTPTTVNLASGTITYNYTAAMPVAATPEPSSIALLGTGLLGAVAVARKRFAQ